SFSFSRSLTRLSLSRVFRASTVSRPKVSVGFPGVGHHGFPEPPPHGLPWVSETQGHQDDY
ncbi:MAG: hypothetical protein QXJ56_04375, partial [Ignisphaera sp.]